MHEFPDYINLPLVIVLKLMSEPHLARLWSRHFMVKPKDSPLKLMLIKEL